MAKKDETTTPPPAETSVDATCPPPAQKESAETPSTQAGCETAPSEICATNIACNVTLPPMCNIGQTGWYTCGHTLATVCTQIQCNQAAVTIGTWFNTCGVPPVTLTCHTGGAQAQITVGPTGWYTCGQNPTCGNNTQIAATTFTQLGCTGWYTCGQPNTQLMGCTTVTSNPTFGCAQANAAACNNNTYGQTGWYTCTQPNTQLMGCTTVTSNPTFGCAQANAAASPTLDVNCMSIVTCVGPTGPGNCPTMWGCPTAVICNPTVLNCAKAGAQANADTTTPATSVCTDWIATCIPPTLQPPCLTNVTCNMLTCPEAKVGHTGWYTCTQPNTQLMGCTTVTSNPTFGCAQANAAACNNNTYGQTGWYTCTQLMGCTTVTSNPTFGCAQANAVTTTVQPTHLMGCTTATSETRCYGNCTYTTYTQLAVCGTGPEAKAGTGNVATLNPPTCYTCTTSCGVSPAANVGTAATVCTQVSCPTKMIGCTGWYTCGQNPTCGNNTQIAATTYTQPIGHCGAPAAQANIGTWFKGCGIPPVTLVGCQTQITCTPETLVPAKCATEFMGGCTQVPQANVGHTGWYTCGQIPTCGNDTKIVATTYTQLGCTGWLTCGQSPTCGNNTQIAATTYTQPIGQCGAPAAQANAGTAATVCTQVSCPTKMIGCTGWYTCGQNPTCGNNTQIAATTYTQPVGHCGAPAAQANAGTAATVCTQVSCPTHMIGCTGWYTCGQNPTTCGNDTKVAATTYTQPIGRTGWYTCPGTLATVCTQVDCPTGIQCGTGPEAQITLMTVQATCTLPYTIQPCKATPLQPACGNNTHAVYTTYTQPVTHCGGPAITVVTVNGCPTTLPTYATRCFICPPQTLDTVCTQNHGVNAQVTVGHTGWYTCTKPGTLATVCTLHDCPKTGTNIPGCNTATSETRCYGNCTYTTYTQPAVCGTGPQVTVGPTGWYTCGGTAATVCTEGGCIVTNNSIGPVCCG